MEGGDEWLAADKLEHLLACFVITLLVANLSGRSRHAFVRRRSAALGSLAALAAGASKEAADEIGIWRSAGASAKDAAADALGVLLAAMLLAVFGRLRSSSRREVEMIGDDSLMGSAALSQMAAVLRTPLLFHSSPVAGPRSTHPKAPRSLLSFLSTQRASCALRLQRSPLANHPLRFQRFRLFTAYGDTTRTELVTEAVEKEDSDDEISLEDGTTDTQIIDTEETVASTVLLSLQSYRDALANKDLSRVAEIAAILLSIEDEKNSLSTKIASLSQVLSTERDRVLRISADFDNFRKRTERERLSLMTNVQSEVIESLLPVLDNFERAKSQIKVDTEGEEKINNSYQSIYKQFLEALTSIGVEAVETVGSPFNPSLHEAIMQEESLEFEEGIIIQEFRKGFKLGERLLRPSMVKVSAGPGPEKVGDDIVIPHEDDEASENIEDDIDS